MLWPKPPRYQADERQVCITSVFKSLIVVSPDGAKYAANPNGCELGTDLEFSEPHEHIGVESKLRPSVTGMDVGLFVEELTPGQ